MQTAVLGHVAARPQSAHNDMQQLCYPTHALCTNQQYGPLGVDFLTGPSSPTLTSDIPAQEWPSPLHISTGEIQQLFLDLALKTHPQLAPRTYGGRQRNYAPRVFPIFALDFWEQRAERWTNGRSDGIPPLRPQPIHTTIKDPGTSRLGYSQLWAFSRTRLQDPGPFGLSHP